MQQFDATHSSINVGQTTGAQQNSKRKSPPSSDVGAGAGAGACGVEPSVQRPRVAAFSSSNHTSSSDTITIRVKDQTGVETYFKVKRSTPMEKVFNAYAQRKGVAKHSLVFLLLGQRINNEQTPRLLDLEENDRIDCILKQQGD